jgi:hypothetical protein
LWVPSYFFLKASFFAPLSTPWVPVFAPLWLKGVLSRESNWGSRSGRNLQLLEIL